MSQVTFAKFSPWGTQELKMSYNQGRGTAGVGTWAMCVEMLWSEKSPVVGNTNSVEMELRSCGGSVGRSYGVMQL